MPRGKPGKTASAPQSEAKEEKSVDSGVPGVQLLSPGSLGKSGNFMLWNDKLYDHLLSVPEIGRSANLLKPKIVDGVLSITNYKPAEIEAPSAAMLDALATDALRKVQTDDYALRVKQRTKTLIKLEEHTWPLLYAYLWNQMDNSSKDRVRNHAGFEEVAYAADCEGLYKIIRETHFGSDSDPGQGEGGVSTRSGSTRSNRVNR